MSDLTLIQVKDEVRIDSRLLAEQLHNKHKNTVAIIERYADKFKRFGHLPFQTEVGKRLQGGGKAKRYAILNEDQAFFLLSLSRNTDRVVELKADLVMAFREARLKNTTSEAHYLPLNHALHNEVRNLATLAKKHGSTTPERIFHINTNKALNAVMGIVSGERKTLTRDQYLLLSTLQAVYIRALHLAIEAGADHREAAQKAKTAALTFMAGAGCLLIGRASA